jgi:DNA-binding NtrC family response regulator
MLFPPYPEKDLVDETKTLTVVPAMPEGPLELVVIDGPRREALPLGERASVVIGRGKECDIVLNDPSISRRHAVLRLAGELSIEDVGSSNGTSVGGVPVEANTRVPISLGTPLELGSVTTFLHRARSARASKPPAALEGAADVPAGVVALAPRMRELFGRLRSVAPSMLNVLLLGETGVGKEVLAESVHSMSARAEGPYLKLNCAALSESLLEAELFGYEKGAFTGANRSKPGLFEAADGGSVFLDEVGDMPLTTQVKLLRVLENGEVTRVGSVRPLKVDVRYIAATNRDLRAAIQQGSFRADLYFRLNGVTLTIPPLRERREDILPLASHFLLRAITRDRRPPVQVSPEARDKLLTHEWPGNARELRAVMERALVFCRGGVIQPEDLLFEEVGDSRRIEVGDTSGQPTVLPPPRASDPPTRMMRTVTPATPVPTSPPGVGPLRDERREFERQRIIEALRATQGNQTRAAELLGVSRRTLINKIEAYGLERPRKR